MAENKINRSCQVLVIGGSAGSLDALLKILPGLKNTIPFPIVIVLHRKNTSDSSLRDLLATKTALKVKEIEDKQIISPGQVYIAPSDYHVLFENRTLLSLDYSEKINYSRPSIDISFESASEVFENATAVLLLSGANADGSAGVKAVKAKGGIVLVQDPASAESSFMPLQALAAVTPDAILRSEELADFINLM